MPDQNQRTKRIVKGRTGNSSHFDAGKSLRDGAPSSEEKELPEGEQNHCRLGGGCERLCRLPASTAVGVGGLINLPSLLPSLGPSQSAPLGDLGFLQEWQCERRFEKED